MSYKKLVRDKIPEIIKNNGDEPIYRVMDDKEYKDELNKKLLEEVNEYLESGSLEELADIEEVILALVDCQEKTHTEFENIRVNKVKKRGAFKNKIYLEGIKND